MNGPTILYIILGIHATYRLDREYRELDTTYAGVDCTQMILRKPAPKYYFCAAWDDLLGSGDLHAPEPSISSRRVDLDLFEELVILDGGRPNHDAPVSRFM